MALEIVGDELWSRMERAVEKVQERLERTAKALEAAGVPYAIVGGNAVRIWVAQKDEAAVRTTRDVDVLVRRSDFDRVRPAMEAAGFAFREVAGLPMFLDSPDAKARDSVHILFTGELLRDDQVEPTPDVEPFERAPTFRTLPLETLVRMKLNSFRLKDQVHLLDMIDVGLIDASWLDSLQPSLRDRLQQLIDNPDR